MFNGSCQNFIGTQHCAVSCIVYDVEVKKKKRVDRFKLSREERPNFDTSSSREEGDSAFTEKMLQRFPWAKASATGLEHQLKKCHKVNCMICKVKVSVRSCGV